MGYLLRRSTEGSFAQIAFEDYMAPRRATDFFITIPENLKDNGYQQKFVCLDNNGATSLELKPIPAGNDGA